MKIRSNFYSNLLHLYISLFVFLIFANSIFGTNGNTRVSYCKHYGDNCIGSPAYYETIDVFDSINRVIQSTDFIRSGCDIATTDSMFRVHKTNQYQYDVNNNVILDTLTFFDTPITYQYVYTYTYDTSNNLLSKKIQFILPSPTHDDSEERYQYLNDSIISDLKLDYDGSVLDTSFYQEITYDSLMRKTSQIRYNYSSFQLSGIYLQNWNYDSLGNLSSQINTNLLSANDSSRTFFFYDNLNNLSSTFFQTFHNNTLSWTSSSRNHYYYNNQQQLVVQVVTYCSDSVCADTSNILYFTYDTNSHLTSTLTKNYFGETEGFEFCNYNGLADTIGFGYGYPTKNGCGVSIDNYYFYNSNEQKDSSHVGIYSGCAFSNIDCNYYNLDNDSMVLIVEYLQTTCANNKVYPMVFNAGGQAPYQYHWSPGIQFSDSTIQNPFVIATTSSIYTLTVTDAQGKSVTDTFALNVFPNQIHPLSIQASGNPPCEGNVTLFYPTDSLNGTWNAFWTFDGSNYSSDSLVADYSGNYQLTINNQYCQYQTDTNLILIPTQHLFINSIGSPFKCNGDSVGLYTTDTVNFTWNTGSISDTIFAHSNGLYYIQLIDSNGCPVKSNEILVHTGISSPNLMNDTSFCSGQSVQLTIQGNFTSYQWSNNSFLPTLNVTSPGIYSVEVGDLFFCHYLDTITVVEFQSPVIDLGSDTLLCQSQTLLLNPGNYSTYLWNDGSTTSNITANYTGIDTVIYAVTVYDNHQCSSNDSITISYSVCAQINSEVRDEVKVFPFPAINEIRMNLPRSTGDLIITNLDSKIIYEQQKQAHLSIDCSQWPSGTYLYQWISDERVLRGKLMVIH